MRIHIWLGLALILVAGCTTTIKTEEADKPLVMIRTQLGDIYVELYPRQAPVTVRNILRYVDENRFAEASFYRVVTPANQPDKKTKIEVIQGGIGFVESDLRLADIEHETTKQTGLRHKDGTVSMARREPGTASSEFFICVGDMPELDHGSLRNPDGQGYAAFGQVVRGMDVVRRIQAGPEKDQLLLTPVKILSFARIERLP